MGEASDHTRSGRRAFERPSCKHLQGMGGWWPPARRGDRGSPRDRLSANGFDPFVQIEDTRRVENQTCLHASVRTHTPNPLDSNFPVENCHSVRIGSIRRGHLAQPSNEDRHFLYIFLHTPTCIGRLSVDMELTPHNIAYSTSF